MFKIGEYKTYSPQNSLTFAENAIKICLLLRVLREKKWIKLRIKTLLKLGFACLVLSSCHNQSTKQAPNNRAKGEFAFLLQYDGKMPAEVGFLTNHVVERRLANLLKDSFPVFISKTTFPMPLFVDTVDKYMIGSFYLDAGLNNPGALVLIDVKNDAMWVDYMNGNSEIHFADNPSLQKPGPFYK